MDDITAIADELIVRGGGDVDPLKLQKLLYYVQVISLIEHHQPAYGAQLQAWNEGPVIREVWEAFKVFGRNAITTPPGQRRPQHQHVLAAIATVMTLYGSMTGEELSRLTHNERPWVEAHGSGRNTVISMNSIQKGYVRVGEKTYALPLQKEKAEAQRSLEQAMCALRPDRDNEEAILAVADEDYTLLTDMVLTHADLDYRVMTDIVHGIASDWTQHPEAAQKALLIALGRPEALVQEEALRGLDKMWRAQRASSHIPAQVMALDLVVAKPKWAV